MSRSSGPPRALGVGERRARFPSPLVIRELSLNPRALRAPTPAAPDSTATAAGAPSADDAPRIRRSRRRAVLPTGRTGRRFAGGACDRLLPALAGGAPDAGGVAVGRAARTACSSSGRTRRPSRTPRGHPSHRIRCTSRPRLRRQCMSQRRRRSTDGDGRLDGASLDAGLHRREAAARVVREAVLGATGGDVVADGVGESERERAAIHRRSARCPRRRTRRPGDRRPRRRGRGIGRRKGDGSWVRGWTCIRARRWRRGVSPERMTRRTGPRASVSDRRPPRNRRPPFTKRPPPRVHTLRSHRARLRRPLARARPLAFPFRTRHSS